MFGLEAAYCFYKWFVRVPLFICGSRRWRSRHRPTWYFILPTSCISLLNTLKLIQEFKGLKVTSFSTIKSKTHFFNNSLSYCQKLFAKSEHIYIWCMNWSINHDRLGFCASEQNKTKKKHKGVSVELFLIDRNKTTDLKVKMIVQQTRKKKKRHLYLF